MRHKDYAPAGSKNIFTLFTFIATRFGKLAERIEKKKGCPLT